MTLQEKDGFPGGPPKGASPLRRLRRRAVNACGRLGKEKKKGICGAKRTRKPNYGRELHRGGPGAKMICRRNGLDVFLSANSPVRKLNG